jgi:hypothetical protein
VKVEGFTQYAVMQRGRIATLLSTADHLGELTMSSSLLTRMGVFVAVHGGLLCGILILL